MCFDLIAMRTRITFLGLYWLCWILLFQFYRVVFMAYHYKKTLELPSYFWAQSARHGLQMDISFASYLLVIPMLLMAFAFKSALWYKNFVKAYTWLTASVIAILVSIDLELFSAWGFRIDGTSLQYLKTPTEAWASISSAPVFVIMAIMVFLGTLSVSLLLSITKRYTPNIKPLNLFLSIPLFLFFTAALIIPIRGGFQLAPMNQSAVFFSNKSFANHAAVNVPWNYASSIFNNSYTKNNPFDFYSEKELETYLNPLYQQNKQTIQVVDSLLKPNILIIIWESFTAKIVAPMGGLPNITPEFNKLTKEGLLFTNIYATGNRSDKGMVGILSGYPAQPTQSIIKIPTKTVSLPSLPKSFQQNGYSTAFYYGGETEFANMKSYFLQQDFNKIIDINTFDKKDMNSKWGAHDHVVLDKLLNDLDTTPQPFFNTIFTLSSHEPFEVPVKTVIKGTSQEKLFLNAHHYTDASIGHFIAQAKLKPWWKNTLVIIIADHGHPLPETKKGKPDEFKIPMLWIGGALSYPSQNIETLASQTDLAATLMSQLKLKTSAFKWSNNILMKDRNSFAYFAFNNGFGWMRPKGYLVRDNFGGNIIEKNGVIDSTEIKTGKSYLQASYSDYLKR